MNSELKDKFPSVAAFVQNKVGENIVDRFLGKYCDNGISNLTTKEQLSITQDMVMKLSILLSAFAISNECMSQKSSP